LPAARALMRRGHHRRLLLRHDRPPLSTGRCGRDAHQRQPAPPSVNPLRACPRLRECPRPTAVAAAPGGCDGHRLPDVRIDVSALAKRAHRRLEHLFVES
jgi:hypothetical protein